MSKKPTILSIAGFDSSCGAGVVADVNTARVLGAHGVAVLTCVTAQNTTGVKDVFPLPEKLVIEQIELLCVCEAVGPVKSQDSEKLRSVIAEFVIDGRLVNLFL